MSKHTPTPWQIGYGDGIFGDVASWSAHMDDVECHEIVIRSGREAVAIIYYGDTDGPSEANARHIVKAVNYHERLVDALRNLEVWAPKDMDAAEQARAILQELEGL